MTGGGESQNRLAITHTHTQLMVRKSVGTEEAHSGI